MRLASLLIMALPLFGAGGGWAAETPSASAAKGQPLRLTPTQMREDLLFLHDDWIKQDKSFNTEQTAEFNRQIAEAIDRVDRLDPIGFWMRVSRAVALSGNGHTNVNGGNPPFPGLPFESWWFPDGLYITATEPEYSELLGARIDRIGSVNVSDALAVVEPLISGNQRRVRALSPKYLRIPALLQRLGISNSATEVRLTVRLRSGRVKKVDLKALSGADPVRDVSEWHALIPSEPDQPNRWPHVLDSAPERPATYQKPVDLEYHWLTGRDVLYIRSNQIQSADGGGLQLSLEGKLLGLLVTEIVPARPRVVIVDLRLNSGGNFGNTILFAQALPKLVRPGGHVYVLVGTSTFSAAIVTAAFLKEAGGPTTVLVGEGMGDDGRFCAEGGVVALPQSHFQIKAASGFQDWGGPCTDLDRCFWANVVWGPKQALSLQPDVLSEATFAEYAAGRDPTLQKVLELAGESR